MIGHRVWMVRSVTEWLCPSFSVVATAGNAQGVGRRYVRHTILVMLMCQDSKVGRCAMRIHEIPNPRIQFIFLEASFISCRCKDSQASQCLAASQSLLLFPVQIEMWAWCLQRQVVSISSKRCSEHQHSYIAAHPQWTQARCRSFKQQHWAVVWLQPTEQSTGQRLTCTKQGFLRLMMACIKW